MGAGVGTGAGAGEGIGPGAATWIGPGAGFGTTTGFGVGFGVGNWLVGAGTVAGVTGSSSPSSLSRESFTGAAAGFTSAFGFAWSTAPTLEIGPDPEAGISSKSFAVDGFGGVRLDVIWGFAGVAAAFFRMLSTITVAVIPKNTSKPATSKTGNFRLAGADSDAIGVAVGSVGVIMEIEGTRWLGLASYQYSNPKQPHGKGILPKVRTIDVSLFRKSN